MAYIIEHTRLRKSQYEAEWQAILAECEERYNAKTNYLPDALWHPYDEPPYMAEAERIFRRRFGVSYAKVFGYWADPCEC